VKKLLPLLLVAGLLSFGGFVGCGPKATEKAIGKTDKTEATVATVPKVSTTEQTGAKP